MSVATRVFEAKVKVGKVIKSYLYYYNEGVRTHDQARKKAKKHGRVISVGKVDIPSLLSKIEDINLNEEPERHYLGGGIYEDELDIDKVLGLTKKKEDRVTRLKNKSRDNQENT